MPLFAALLDKPAISAAVAFLKPILNWFTPKRLLYLGLLCCLLFTLYKGYHWAYDRGSVSRQSEIDQLTVDLTNERTRLTVWQRETKQANETFLAQQETLRQSLQTQLDEANLRAAQRKVEYRDVYKYITQADDAACPIPVNFGLLHNYSIEGTPPGTLDQLSDAAPGVSSAPSTLTLSQYLTVATHNNSEAVRRGDIIRQWEQWYDASKEQFEAAQRKAAEAIRDGINASTLHQP